MSFRKIEKYTDYQEMSVGPFKVKQPLPSSEIDGLSPFLLLHHAGPQTHAAGSIRNRLSPHPHRGFEPVTFLFSGKIHHKDSAGNEGFLQSGDVQWMTAGSGIIHSEGPSDEFAKEGGEMELIQLWVNLPREHKMAQPNYQDIRSDAMPLIEEDGFRVKLVAGDFRGQHGPASTFTPMLAMMAWFNENGKLEVDIPEGFQTLLYVLDGSVNVNGTGLEGRQLGASRETDKGTKILVESKAIGKMLILAGEPIHEPVASYGPFVMNYPGEIRQAILDYEMGKMGILES